MAEMTAAHDHHEPNYMAIFWWLLGLTIAEIVVTYMHLPRLLMISTLITMAVVKAVLVAAYFMHLRFERIRLILICAVPPLLLTILAIGLLSEAGHYPPSVAPPAVHSQPHGQQTPASHEPAVAGQHGSGA